MANIFSNLPLSYQSVVFSSLLGLFISIDSSVDSSELSISIDLSVNSSELSIYNCS